MAQPLIDASTAAAIAEGRHGDPFAVLGLHKRGGKWLVVAFDPGAEAMRILVGKAGKPIDAVMLQNGVFAAELPKKSTYRLQASGYGATWEFEDPFRFGPVLGELDEYLLGEGTHKRLWQVLGAHVRTHEGVVGTHFAVWAPNARRVSVVGDFNRWDGRRAAMRHRQDAGVWEIFLPEVGIGQPYKFEIVGPDGVVLPLKADPFAFRSELRPSPHRHSGRSARSPR